MALDWDKLRVFHAVAEAGSFKHAEKILHISHSAISRHINQLEQEVKTQLFYRHARGIRLTLAGKIMMDSVHDMYGKLEMAKSRINASIDSPTGHLRISTPLGLGANWLTPRIKAFTKLYPEMKIDLLFQDEIIDVNMGEADIAIRLVKPEDGDAICQEFLKVKFQLYASKTYLKEYGTPKALSDLADHRLIALDSNHAVPLRYFNWFLQNEEDMLTPSFNIDNPYGIYKAVRNDLGIGVIPNVLIGMPEDVAAQGITALLPKTAFFIESYFIYPTELRRTQKIRSFKDFFKTEAKSFEAKWNQ